MATNMKTTENDSEVLSFINSVENAQRQQDALVLLQIYTEITAQKAKMWGSSIVGFGRYAYTLANGKQQQFMRSGFSPRKQNLTIYVGAMLPEDQSLLANLGKHKTSKACLYINKLADINLEILKQIITQDLTIMDNRYPQ
ncbi:DUF1801 domain-containing protein [Alteromonas sp. M12]|uniref:DUF1801 domain-containing protein n=1 Tax=Alteromonas sp. M12 TaxID=3135644 RepID=UPI00319EB468